MTFVAPTGMECLLRRCHQEAGFSSVFRSVLITVCLILVLCVSLYPGLWSIGVRLHSAWTGSFVPGHHSILLLNSPAEQAAKDIGRYYWKGEIQDASEILMVFPPLRKPRSPQLPGGVRQPILHEVDG
ncbi:protein CutA homolog isoform X3 [Antennarius striatus]|uniref:protein CutA homolog isoform X3 n=1 Tax=Antennarius striatus TaxID=241820 RepID=UPI0035B0EDE2